MPDFRETVEKLKTAAAAFATGEGRVKPITREAADDTSVLCSDALALLTEQEAALATLRAENAIRLAEAIRACNLVAEQSAEIAVLRAGKPWEDAASECLEHGIAIAELAAGDEGEESARHE